MESGWRGVPHKCLTVAFAAVVFVVGINVARANSESACFTYLIFPGANITAAPEDGTIQMAGSGQLCIHPKSVAGGGTFTRRDAAGAVVATGTWSAVELLSFDDFGTLPGIPPSFHGGLAVMRVHLAGSTGGAGVDGILQIDCAINQPGVPNKPEDLTEGVRLALEGGPNFNKKIHGGTLYIAI
jgi:hypothetical protein